LIHANLKQIWERIPELSGEVDYALRELAFDAVMAQGASDQGELDGTEKALYAE